MTEIACASGVELLMDYLEGTLAADVRVALETHVLGARCVAFIESTANARIMRTRRRNSAASPRSCGFLAQTDAARSGHRPAWGSRPR
jgi:hypothetical protein